MPPSPTTIPTSFVPKQPVQPGTRYTKSGGNTFMLVALGIFMLVLLATAGIFGYERFLISVRDGKASEVQEAERRVSSETVESFIEMRNRFSVAQTILDEHVSTSRFFEMLERVTLGNVRFTSMTFELLEDGSAKIEMTGVARTFNALAAQSAELATEKQVRRAIFADIAVAENGTVSFTLSAELDPDLLVFTVAEVPPIEAPVVPATSAPATSTPLTATSTPTTSPAL